MSCNGDGKCNGTGTCGGEGCPPCKSEKYELANGQYGSPRWSGEILDCSMPMTFDTYSVCSYNCLYCFSFFQRGIGRSKGNYLNRVVRSVNVARIKKMFSGEPSQFSDYIKDRKTMQWGGLSDQFDNYEMRFGVTLELLRFFKSIDYPLCFSTKSEWWTRDERYIELFRGQSNWSVKFSIITSDEDGARHFERGAPSPNDRFLAMERVAKVGFAPTLRLRPFIIGLTDGTLDETIKRAADSGARAVSTEFMCIEGRGNEDTQKRYKEMGRYLGYDLLERYKTET